MRPGRNSRRQRESLSRRRERRMMFLILLLALVLRLLGLGKSLWLDEVMTVENASRPFAEMLEHLAGFDAHPPLYQSVQWLWLHLGQGNAFVRLPSVAAGVVGVWLAYLIARRLFDRRAGLAACLLMAASCFHIYYSQEARLNALVTALFLAQTWLLLRILHQRGKAGWGWWAAYGVAGLLCLYTYALCILTIGALALLYLWLSRKGRRQIAALVVVHVAIVLLFLPWAPRLRQTTARVADRVQELQDAAGRPGPARIAAGVAAWGFGPHTWKQREWAGTVLGLALVAAAGVALANRRTRRPLKMLATLFVLPLAGYLLLPMPRVQEYDPKHLIFLQPILIIALTGTRVHVTRCARQRGFVPLLYVLLALVSLNAVALAGYYRSDFQKENWEGMFLDVGSKLRAQDAIIYNPEYVGYALEYCAETPDARAGMKALAIRGIHLDPEVTRVWLIECRSPVARPAATIRARLEDDNWEQQKQKHYPGAVGDLKWTLFSRASPTEGVQP